MYIKDQKRREFKNGKPLFKQMIISKDEMKNLKKKNNNNNKKKDKL